MNYDLPCLSGSHFYKTALINKLFNIRAVKRLIQKIRPPGISLFYDTDAMSPLDFGKQSYWVQGLAHLQGNVRGVLKKGPDNLLNFLQSKMMSFDLQHILYLMRDEHK